MTIIDGKEVAAAMRREIAAEVEAMVAEGKPAPIWWRFWWVTMERARLTLRTKRSAATSVVSPRP